MEDLVATEEQLAHQKLRQQIIEAHEAAEKHLSPIQDYVNFTLQKAFHKCAYKCFDKTGEELQSCLENCAGPLYDAEEMHGSVLAEFQEKVHRSLLLCRDKYEAAKFQKKTVTLNDVVSCTDESIQENIKMLPYLADTLKASLGMTEDNKM